MVIRQASVDDAERVLDCLTAFWSDGCDTVTLNLALPSLSEERDWISEKNGQDGVVFVAEWDGTVVGMIDASVPKAREFQHTCEFGMSVLENYRNQGIGRSLILRLLDWAETRGLQKVELNVFSRNAPGIALYVSLGFVEDGRRIDAVKLQDNSLCDLIHMSKFTASANKALNADRKDAAG